MFNKEKLAEIEKKLETQERMLEQIICSLCRVEIKLLENKKGKEVKK